MGFPFPVRSLYAAMARLTCALALAGPGFAQGWPERLLDSDPTSRGGALREHRVVRFGNHAWYAGAGAGQGIELHRAATDGSSRQRVADLWPGPGDGWPFALTPVGGRLFFVADDGQHGFELWSTDGTTTALVRDVYPGLASAMVPDDQRREPLGVLNGVVYFGADDGSQGFGLWRSDGTAAGTRLVRILGVAGDRTGLAQWSVANGFALFLRVDPVTGFPGLWQTDGTAGGTRRLRELPPPRAVGLRTPYKLHAVDDGVFVTGADTLLHVRPAAGSSTITSLRGASGTVHSGFAAITDPLTTKGVFLFSGGTYLWRSDGTIKGTVPFFPASGLGVLQGFEQEPAVIRDRMLFFGFDLQHGEEPWITDGTAAGTRLLADLRPGPPDSTVPSPYGERYRIVSDGARYYFPASDGKSGVEIWESDGTRPGTRMVADLRPGAAGSRPRRLLALPGGGVMFVADDGKGDALWVYDPRAGKVRVAATDFHAATGRTAPSRVLGLMAHDRRLYFAASDGRSGSELWSSDGSRTGTGLLRDIQPGAGSGLRHHDLTNGPEYGSFAGISTATHLYFNAYGQPGQLGLYRTDGTRAGTEKVRDLDLIGGDGWPLSGRAIGENLFFHGYQSGVGEGLFTLRVGASSLLRLSPTWPGRYYQLGGRLLYTDGFPPALRGVWVTDGTPRGTFALARFQRFVTDPFLFARIGRVGYFSMMDQGGVLWRTDGTIAGSQFLRLAPIRGMAAIGDRLWTLEEASGGAELKVGDGTTAGTVLVAAGLPASSRELVAVGDRLFFIANQGVDSELWGSDGTRTGTRQLARFPVVDSVTARITDLLPVGSRRLFFRVSATAGVGGELWSSDGTVAGTRPVADVQRGPAGANGDQLTLVNGRLFFLANDGRHGSVDADLFALDSGAVSYRNGPGCAFDGYAPELTATDPVLGGSFALQLRGAANRPGMFILGFESPLPVALGRGCRIYPATNTGYRVSAATDGQGRWRLGPLQVPNLAALRGLRLTAQIALASDPSMPLGADLSNGAVLVIGD